MSMTNQTRDIARFSAQTKDLADAAAAFSSRAELALHGVYEISKILGGARTAGDDALQCSHAAFELS